MKEHTVICVLFSFRYRQARLIENAQRRNRQRRDHTRRPRSAGQNEEWDRRGPLPGTDLPPSYNNLGFTGMCIFATLY